MQDSTLLKIALATSIIGLAVLFMVSRTNEFSQNPYAVDDGQSASITGKVLSARQDAIGTRIVLEVPIDVLVFGENVSVGEGQRLKIKGTVQEYEGRKEMIADSISAIR